jgi:hypothetical protein
MWPFAFESDLTSFSHAPFGYVPERLALVARLPILQRHHKWLSPRAELPLVALVYRDQLACCFSNLVGRFTWLGSFRFLCLIYTQQ